MSKVTNMLKDGLWSGVQAEGWWKTTDDQNGSSSGQWMSANDQTAWEPAGPVGGVEMNSIEKNTSNKIDGVKSG